MMSKKRVRAAGGVVVDDTGRLLLVHRPRYDAWSCPTGKLDAGETLVECALREVAEESGDICDLGTPVSTVHYVDNKGRDKDVHYWLMTPRRGTFEANDEVDQIRWVTPDEARQLLSYSHDLDVLRDALG